MKNPARIEPATLRFVAQHLNHCATAVPIKYTERHKITQKLHNFSNEHFLDKESLNTGKNKYVHIYIYKRLNVDIHRNVVPVCN